MIQQNDAMPVVSLEYAREKKTPWRPVIQVILLTIVALCVATLIRSVGFVAFGYWRTGSFSTAIEMDPAISITLIALGWGAAAFVMVSAGACLRFRRSALRLLIIALIVENVIMLVGRGIAAFFFAQDSRYGLADIIYYTAYSYIDGLEFLIPSIALIWIFTRRVVREMFR